MNAVDLRITRIDEMELSLETAGAEILQDRVARRSDARARADYCDRAGRKQLIEAIGGHRKKGP